MSGTFLNSASRTTVSQMGFVSPVSSSSSEQKQSISIRLLLDSSHSMALSTELFPALLAPIRKVALPNSISAVCKRLKPLIESR